VSRRIPGGLVLATIASACALLLFAAGAKASGPDLDGTHAAALLEESTGAQLYGSNATAELAIASTTKLMTALVTLEHVHNLNRMFTQNDFVPAPSDSQIGLVPGERMSVHDLLLAMLLPSADDAAEDLAYNVGGGSLSRFIAMMNTRARQLGLTHTHYSTPSGLDTPGNYSSASDLTKLARYLLTHQPFFRRAVDTTSAVLQTGNHPREIVNLDDLVAKVPWINGVKTGHTLEAGYVLVSSGTQNGMTLIGAVLGTPSEASRDANALALLQWGFASFHIVSPVHAGTVLARLNVRDQPSLHAPIIAGASYRTVLARADRVRIRLLLPKQLKGPMQRGVVVGSAQLIAGGRTLDRIPLVLARSLPAVSSLTLAARFITRPITLVFLVALLVAVLAAFAMIRQRARGRSRVRRKSAHDHHRHAQRRA
jgi:D-alanyl-D-alanine carboxypeptidase (penicillin-binding protein 5/6)